MNEFEDCYTHLKDDIFVIGNSQIERSWDLRAEGMLCLSLKDKHNGIEWFNPDGGGPFFNPSLSNGMGQFASLETEIGDDYNIGARHLAVILTFDYSDVSIRWTHRIYPHIPVIRSSISCAPHKSRGCQSALQDSDSKKKNEFYNLETGGINAQQSYEDYMDMFPLKQYHCSWEGVRFNDATDHHNNLIQTQKGLFYRTEKNFVQGNLLIITDNITEAGLIVVKEDPTPGC